VSLNIDTFNRFNKSLIILTPLYFYRQELSSNKGTKTNVFK
jgi:hypothetical protein